MKLKDHFDTELILTFIKITKEFNSVKKIFKKDFPMKTLKAVIIDDENSSIENLTILVAEFCPQIKIINTAKTLSDAELLLKKGDFDLVFLDVQFGTKTIFNTLQKISPFNFSIIFISAYNYALRAFRFNAVDYLLKPIEIDLLVESVQKIVAQNTSTDVIELTNNTKELSSNSMSNLAVSVSNGYEIIALDQILFFSANGSYTIINLIGGRKITSSKNLKFYENLTFNKGFIRIHNSSLVNAIFVKKIYKSDGGYLVMQDDNRLNISISKKEFVFKAFGLS